MTSKYVTKKETVNKMLNWADGDTCKILDKGLVARITIEGVDPRTIEQNKKEHAMIDDIRKQAVFRVPGKVVRMSDYAEDEAKSLLVMWFANEMASCGTPLKKPPKLVTDPFLGIMYTIRPSTKDDLEIDETSQFIEWLYKTGAETGVKWSEPSLRQYEEYRQAK